MRIGYVLKKFPRLSETFILNELTELERHGAEVTVFSLHQPDDGRFHRRLADLRGEIVYLPQRKPSAVQALLREELVLLAAARDRLWPEIVALLDEDRRDTWTVLRCGIEVAIQARRRGIEHLHAHFATVASYAARVAHAVAELPFSFTCHAKDIYRDTVDGARFSALLEAAAFAVTVCDANRRHIRERLAAEPAGRVEVLYNGVDLAAFSPAERAPAARPLVLGIGRLVEKKGFAVLIDAVAGLHAAGIDCDCVIVGDGEERDALRERLAGLGDGRIRLHGAATQDEVRALLREAWILALPCVIGADGNRDALPTVLLEALAAGVPVVSTPVGGVEEIVDGGRCGVLVPPGDAAALQAAVGELLGDGPRRAELAGAGRARAERLFDLHRNARTLLGWFERGRG